MASPAPQAADALTLATLALCTASYLPDITTIPAAVQNAPPLAAGGRWQCVWGPVQDSDESNLALVAGYFPGPNAGPQTICVTVRGTDFDITDIWGMLEQIWEDLDASDPQPMPWALDDPARIASGTLDGLGIIQGLTANGQTLGQFLTAFFSQPANAHVTILVTGHSLGGCLATIVATWIRVLLPNFRGAIQPITFAAPTAGNSEFATYYGELFPTARRFQNSLDVIPHAFYDLGGINSIYANSMLDTPDIIWLGVLGMEAALDIMEASYVQPAQGQQIVPGAFLLNDATDWYAQALHQHHLATYLALLTGTQVDTTALPQQSVAHAAKARLIKRIGSLETALERLADR
ncbi:MAG: lipase family protein [Alphaproteobacteria bacterium]